MLLYLPQVSPSFPENQVVGDMGSSQPLRGLCGLPGPPSPASPLSTTSHSARMAGPQRQKSDLTRNDKRSVLLRLRDLQCWLESGAEKCQDAKLQLQREDLQSPTARREGSQKGSYCRASWGAERRCSLRHSHQPQQGSSPDLLCLRKCGLTLNSAGPGEGRQRPREDRTSSQAETTTQVLLWERDTWHHHSVRAERHSAPNSQKEPGLGHLCTMICKTKQRKDRKLDMLKQKHSLKRKPTIL